MRPRWRSRLRSARDTDQVPGEEPGHDRIGGGRAPRQEIGIAPGHGESLEQPASGVAHGESQCSRCRIHLAVGVDPRTDRCGRRPSRWSGSVASTRRTSLPPGRAATPKPLEPVGHEPRQPTSRGASLLRERAPRCRRRAAVRSRQATVRHARRSTPTASTAAAAARIGVPILRGGCSASRNASALGHRASGETCSARMSGRTSGFGTLAQSPCSGALAGCHRSPVDALVEHHRHAVEIGQRGDVAAGELLGGHIGRRADQRAGLGEGRLAGVHASRAEVREENAITGDEDVGGLDVTVDDALTVRRGSASSIACPSPSTAPVLSGPSASCSASVRPSTYSMA